MWNQLRQEQENDSAAAGSATPGRRAASSGDRGSGNDGGTAEASDAGAAAAVAARRKIMPTSQPSPMATPAKPRTPQQKTPGTTSRYADYLSEVADTSDIVTPGKSPLILTAPTFEDDAADADGGAGAGADADDNLLDGLNFDDVGVSPGGAAPAAAAVGVQNHRHSSSSSSSSSSDNAVTMDVASKSEVPFAAEFTAGFFPPHLRSVPSGIGGLTNASSVSGITEMASGMSSSSGDGVYNSSGSTPDEEEEEEEEVEEIIMSSSDSNEEEDSDEIGNGAGDGATPVPIQQQTVRIAPTSAPQTSRGPLSPFSPDARRARTEIRRHRQPRHASASAPCQWSLLPCRKVSVLIRVKPPGAKWDGERRTDDGDDDSSAQLGIFPLLPPGVSASHAGRADDNAPAIGLLSLASELSSSATTGSSQAANSLVVVNPTAFGTRLPSDLTMETARLVAEVGNIDSEDWARRYRFDDILWPNDQDGSGRSGIGSSAGVGAGRSDSTLIAAARAMAGDALSGRSSVLCTLGSVGSGRSYAAFGRAGLRVAMGRKRTRRVPSDFDESDRVATLDRAGILGLLVAELNDFSRTDQVDFTVSLLEIVDDDVLRDLFRTPNAEFDPGQPRLRHPDHFGAVVQNLTELTFGSVKDLEKALSDAAQHSVGPFAVNMGRGHLIATVKIAVSNGRRKDTIVQIVDLNPGEDPDAEVIGAAALDTTQRRRAASVRKSLSGLRGVLRGLIVQEAQKSSYQTLSYRECTLTKLLQRSLDSIDSRAILIATVDPAKEAYHRSVQTLNYVNRLWIKPGITAQSPFEARVKGVESDRKSTARTLFPTTVAGSAAAVGGNDEDGNEDDALLKKLRTSNDRSVLTSLVSDPRQRVATLLGSSKKADKRNAEPEPASSTPVQAAVKKSKSSSSTTIRKKVGGTFDSVLAKLDALESSPTYDRLHDDFNDTVVTKITRDADLLAASKLHHEMSESSSVVPSVSSSQRSAEDIEEIHELKEREARLRIRLEESKNALAATKLEIEAANKKDAQGESVENRKLQDKVDENIRLGERETALANELNALRSYANHAAGGNIREQQRLNDIIDQLRQEIADEKFLTMKYREEASKSSDGTSIAPSQTASTSSSEAYLVAQIEALQKEKAQLQMDVADERLQKEKLKEEVKQASSSSGSQTASTGDADLIAQIEELQQEKEQRSTRHDEEIEASDDALVKVKEELAFAKDQAKVAYDAKRLAEDELGLVQTTAATTEGEAKSVEAASGDLKDRQIDQLKAEKKLMQEVALSMKRRLETDKIGLQRRLETVQEEADTAKYRQGLAENELEMIRVEASSSTKSSDGDLQRENEVLREELKRMKDSSSESHTSSSEAELKAEIERLQSQVIQDSANNADAMKLLKEELGEARYDKLVAEEEARLLRADDTSKSSGGNSAADTRLTAELTTTRDAFEEHKKISDREKKQLEYDKSALQARLSDVINRDIRTSNDVIDSLRQKLRESYDKAKAREDDREHQREQLLQRISDLDSALEHAQYAEHVAKEEARVLKESSSSHTSSSEAELTGQLRAAQESLEEHKRGARQLKHDKDALKARLASLVDEVAVLQKEKSDAIAAARVEEKAVADYLSDRKDIRIQQLLSEIDDMSEVKRMTDDELDRVREMLVAATRSSGEGESSASKSASIASSNESALIAKIEKLQAEKRKQTAENAEAARIARNAMAAVRSELEATQRDAMSKAAERSDEIKDSDDALALVKGQFEEAYAKARAMATQRLAEAKASDDRIDDLMAQVREAVHAKKQAEDELKKERGSSAGSQESSNDTALMAQIESLVAAQKEQEAQSTEAARIAEGAINALRDELETAYKEARAKAMKRSDEIKDTDDALALLQEQLDEAHSKAISKASEQEAKIKASDDLLVDTKAQLAIAKEQARLAYDAKVLAEDELRVTKSSSSGSAAAEDELRGKSSSSSSSSEGLLLRQIEQLKAEKKLTQQMAVAMKKRFEGRNRDLTRKLDTLQEEVDDAKQKLSDERSRSSAETSSFVSGTGSAEREERLQRDLDQLRAEKKVSDKDAVIRHQKLQDQVADLEAQVKAAKTAKLLAEGELRRRRDGDSTGSYASDEAEDKAIRTLQRQLAESRAKEATASEEKRAVDHRLDKETEAKLDAEQKLEDLQKRLREKQLADRVSDTSSASGSNASVTDALKARVRELEAERMVTMENFRALEQNLGGGKSSIGDQMNYLRNKQVQSLVEEIEQLEKAVDSLTDENEELQKASIALEKDQNLHQRLLEDKLAPAIKSDGSRSPQLEEQVEALTSHIDVLKHQLAVALRGEEQSKAAEKSEREEVLSLQSRMDKTLMQLQALKSSSRTRVAAKEEEISSLREKLKQTEADNESLRSEIASSDLSTVKSSQSHASAAELKQLRRSNQKLVAKIEELTTDLSTTKRNLIENQENTMNVMSQYESIRLAKKEDEHLLRQSQAKTRELEQTIDAMRMRNDITLSKSKKDAMSAEDKLHKRINVTEHAHAERVSLLERRLTEVHNEREDLREKNEDLVKQLAHERHVRREQSIEAKKASAILQEEIDTAKEEMVSLHNQILALTEIKDKLEEKIGKKKDQILALKSEAKNAKEEIAKLKLKMEEDAKAKVRLSNEMAVLESARLEDSRIQKRLESENSALRSSIKQCDESMEAMRKEVFELQSAADDALARLEAKKESSEKRLRQEIRVLEEKLQAASYLEREETEKALRNAVGELEEELRQTSEKLQDANLNYHDAEEKMQTLVRENDSLKQDLFIVEAELRRHKGQTASSYHNIDDEGPNVPLSERLRHERSLRVKAEEIALNLAERAKVGAVDRHSVDSELGYLNKTNDAVDSRTSAIVATGRQEGGGGHPPYSSRHYQAIEEIDKLKPVVSTFQSLYEMKDQSVRELQSNLSSTMDELERYKRLSSRLQQQIDEAESLSRRRAREEFSSSAAAASVPPRPDQGTPYRYSGAYEGRSSTADEATQRWRREY